MVPMPALQAPNLKGAPEAVGQRYLKSWPLPRHPGLRSGETIAITGLLRLVLLEGRCHLQSPTQSKSKSRHNERRILSEAPYYFAPDFSKAARR